MRKAILLSAMVLLAGCEQPPTSSTVVPIPRFSSVTQATSDFVWITSFGPYPGGEAPDTVRRISKLTNTVVAAIGLQSIGSSPYGVGVDDSSVWVANDARFTGAYAVSRIDKATNAILASIPTSQSAVGIAVDRDFVWVTTGNSFNGLSQVLLKIDKRTNEITDSIPLTGQADNFLAVDSDFVWIAGNPDIIKVSKTSLTVVATINVTQGAFGIAVDHDAVWVAQIGLNEVLRIQKSDGAITDAIQGGLSAPGGIAVDSTSVWVANMTGNSVSRIDKATKTVVATIPVGSSPWGVSVDQNSVWVCNGGSGTVSRVDKATNTVVATTPVGVNDFSIGDATGFAFDALFPLGNTPSGSQVSVIPAQGLSLTFQNVTGAGQTTVATSGTGPLPPSGFALGNPAVYYDLSTTATFQDFVTVCIDYSGIQFDTSPVSLFHFENSSWVDRTSSLDETNHIICAQVSSFSPFLIAARKTNQAITFSSLSNKTFGAPAFTISASASSGLPVSFSASGSCTVSGATVSLTGVGMCAITAYQGGDATFNPAPNVQQSFAVLYNTAVGHGFLQPINTPPQVESVFKIGSTIPVKFQLFLADGVTPVSAAVAVIQVNKVSSGVPSAVNETVTSTVPNQGVNFRYDPTSQQYIFNLGTKGWTSGSYQITALLDDGSKIMVVIGAR